MLIREVIPFKGGLDLRLTLPGSKSITNRALLCAALAKGKTKILGALQSDDIAVMLTSLKKLGVLIRQTDQFIEVTGVGGRFKKKGKLTLDLHNAGTATRFLTALMILRPGQTIITGDKRMQERPIADLVEGLRQMGGHIDYIKKKGCPPLLIRGGDIHQKMLHIKMKGDKSSQYFSALLMIGPLLGRPLHIEVLGKLVSKPYIDTTIAVMKAFGIEVVHRAYQSFLIQPQSYKAIRYRVEGDASSASYFSALQFLHGGSVGFDNLKLGQSIQGDARFNQALRQLKKLSPRQIDMEAMPDSAMTLAIAAVFAKGKTKITGLSTLKIKETDRLLALKTELSKVGAKVRIGNDWLMIEGLDLEQARKAQIKTYNDHRMAMCFAVLGSMIPGVVIENSDCTQKTYPDFWLDLERVYINPMKLRQKNLVFTGMRCSGKSYLGKRIARLLKRSFVDLDQQIERQEKMSIPEIVKHFGWPYLRNVEQKICSEYATQKNLVISTGGGVVLHAKNMKALQQNGVNVFLFTDPNVITNRLRQEAYHRPSLTHKGTLNEIADVWEERRDLYLKYADKVLDNTSGKVLKASLNKFVS